MIYYFRMLIWLRLIISACEATRAICYCQARALSTGSLYSALIQREEGEAVATLSRAL